MNGIAATIGGSGRRDMFYLDSGFAMKQRFWDGAQWTADWITLGGKFISAPAAVATMVQQQLVGFPAAPSPSFAGLHIGHPLVQRIDVFGLGLDFAMYHKVLVGTPHDSSDPWERLAGTFTSAPAALALDSHVHLFASDANHKLAHLDWDGSPGAWTANWENVEGYLSSAPSVVSGGSGRLDVFARGADFSLRYRKLENGQWSVDWENLGGSLASPPVAVTWGPNRLDIFAIGHDNTTIIHRWWDGTIWNDWENAVVLKDLGQNLTFTSMPAVATWGPNRLDVFATASDGAVYHASLQYDTWSKPESLGLIPAVYSFASTPTVLAPAANSLDLIAAGEDQNLYHKSWEDTGWQPVLWEQIGDKTRLPSRYFFSIDRLWVDRARSLNTDTVSGQCSLAVGNWPVLNATQSQGDLGGTAPKEGVTNLLKIGPITVELVSHRFSTTPSQTHKSNQT